MQYVYEYVFGAREFIFVIRFEIWPILREMGFKKGVFKVKKGVFKVKMDKNTFASK